MENPKDARRVEEARRHCSPISIGGKCGSVASTPGTSKAKKNSGPSQQ
jgi:hypothetical protein